MSKTNLEHANFDARLDALLDEALAPDQVAPDMPADLASRIADATAPKLVAGAQRDVVATIGGSKLRWVTGIAAAILITASAAMFYMGLTTTNNTNAPGTGVATVDPGDTDANSGDSATALSHEAYIERELALLDQYMDNSDSIDSEIGLLSLEIELVAGNVELSEMQATSIDNTTWDSSESDLF